MLHTENLIKQYNTFELNMSGFSVARGEIVGLVGNNGAGKTTFLRLALDLIKATSGAVFSKNINVANDEGWKDYTGSYLDSRFLIDFLTPEEYFEFIAATYHLSDSSYNLALRRCEDFFNDQILHKGKKYIRDMSDGNQQKIGIAAALLMQPEMLILDEPFNSLDPTSQIRLKELLVHINHEQGTTIILSSHDLKHISEICTRISILEDGKIVKDMSTNEDTLVQLEAYFYPKGTQVF